MFVCRVVYFIIYNVFWCFFFFLLIHFCLFLFYLLSIVPSNVSLLVFLTMLYLFSFSTVLRYLIFRYHYIYFYVFFQILFMYIYVYIDYMIVKYVGLLQPEMKVVLVLTVTGRGSIQTYMIFVVEAFAVFLFSLAYCFFSSGLQVVSYLSYLFLRLLGNLISFFIFWICFLICTYFW